MNTIPNGKSCISFKISLYSLDEKILKINLQISNVGNRRVIKLYKNKLQWFDIESDRHINDKGAFVHIENEYKEFLEIQYKVKLESLGKHGYLGYVEENLITFSGEQVLILPVELLTMDDNKSSDFIESISLEYNFNKTLRKIVPYENIQLNDNNDFKNKYSFCIKPMWSDIYELMKSCYVLGDFEQIQYKENKGILNIYLHDLIREYYPKGILDELKNLYIYYVDLFKMDSKQINIVIFPYANKNHEEIFGGSGQSVIGATFDLAKNLRHWQLLSHRMFHSFMDSKIRSQELHMPPNVWITEGLATYYENMALKSLSNNIKNKLGIVFYKDKYNRETSKEFSKLFNRYLYFKLRDENKFSIIPMEEYKIKSYGQLEFLHYTQAPLIIKVLEDIIEQKTGEKNNIINYLINKKDKNQYSTKIMMHTLIGQQEGNEFAMNFLFNSEIIPLWYLKSEDNVNEIINYLNDAEYIFWTWFRLEDFNYKRVQLNNDFSNKKHCYIKNDKILFNNEEVENSIKRFSIALYKLLKNI